MADKPIGRPVTLDAEGTVTCVCGEVIEFLPAELPEAGPHSVNHPGCPAALHDGETINLIDRAEVEAHYRRRKPAAG